MLAYPVCQEGKSRCNVPPNQCMCLHSGMDETDTHWSRSRSSVQYNLAYTVMTCRWQLYNCNGTPCAILTLPRSEKQRAYNADKDLHHIGTLPHIPCKWRHCGRVCLHSGPLGFRNSFQCSQLDIYNSGYSQCWHNDLHGGIGHLSGCLIREIWRKTILYFL